MNLRELKPRGEPDKYIQRPTLDEDSQRNVDNLWESHAGLIVQPRREPWARIKDAVRVLRGRRGDVGATGATGAAGTDASLPSGIIVMSHLLSLGAGWQLCDGTNGTPDLRDKFIAAAGGQYAGGDTGGHDSYAIRGHFLDHLHTIQGTSIEVQSGTGATVLSAASIPDSTGDPTWTPGQPPNPATGVTWPVNGADEVNHYQFFGDETASFGDVAGLRTGFDNRPQYHALYFHMKL